MNIDEVDKLDKIIKSKNWDIFDDIRPDGKTTLDTLVRFMSDLEKNQRTLIYELLCEYLIVREYRKEVIHLLSKFVEKSEDRPILISSLRKFGEEKVKSGPAFTFEFNGCTDMFPEKMFSFAEDPSSKRFQEFKGYKVLVDDFIGTGNQCLEMIAALKLRGFLTDFDLIASIVIQEEGKLALENAGYNVIASYIRPKSIENLIQTSGRDKEKTYELYDAIEALTECPEKFRRGYGASEATVSLKKTPNNTLPIFWFQGKKRWPAPFPRPKS